MLEALRQTLKSLTSDSRLSEVLAGSVYSLGARVIGAGMSLVVSLIVARVYGARMTGVLALVLAFLAMARIPAVMGTEFSVLRLVPEHVAKYSVTSAFRAYRKVLCLVVCNSFVVGAGLYFGAGLIAAEVHSKGDVSYYFAACAPFVICVAFIRVNAEAVRGLRLIRTLACLRILPNAVMLAVLSVLLVVSHRPSDPILAQLIAWGATAFVGALVADWAFRRKMTSSDIVQSLPVRKLLALSLPMMMTGGMYFIIGQVGVLVLGIYRPASEVGYYSIAVKFSALTTVALTAINSMAAPKFSELFHAGLLDELFHVAQKSAKWVFWATAPMLLLLVVLGRPLLSLFGDGFVVAYFPMLILVLGQLVNSLCGSTAYFMNMTGHQGALRNIVTLASVLNLLLAVALIPRFGLYGAALAGTLSLALWNVWTALYIKRNFGKTIGYLPFRA